MATPMAMPQKIVAIIDDDPGMLVSLRDLLGARGFGTSVFSSAEEWLERGAAIHADCMLVDVYLGGMSGIELQRRLRASGSTLPIILMTARYDAATRSQAREAGCATLLCKPFGTAQLIEAIETATG
jgi:FixJ family two-component response regulator